MKKKDNYIVSVGARTLASSTLLNPNTPKRRLERTGQRITAFFAVLMILAMSFAGTMSTAQTANADVGEMITEGFNKIFCSGSPTGYSAADKGILSPNTGNGNTRGATPYEKYGMSGTDWSVWVGFNIEEDSISADEFTGRGSSRGIISAVGGNGEDAGLDTMVGNYKGKEANYPGLFNTAYECSTFSARNFPTMLGNLMLNTAEATTWLSGYAYQTAAIASDSIYTNLEIPVTSVVTALKDKLYFQYLTPMIMIAALWMAYVGLVKRKTTEFMGGLAWLIIAMVGSVAFMTNPMHLPKLMNATVTGISQSGMSAITSSTLEGKDSLCYVAPGSGEPGANQSLRGVQCNLWYSFVYTPWSVGQFGASPTKLTKLEADDHNGFLNRVNKNKDIIYDGNGVVVSVLTKTNNKDAKTDGNKLSLVTPKLGSENRPAPAGEQNWALYLLDHKVNWDNADEPAKRNKVREQIHVAANQLSPSDYNATYRGDNGESRVAMGGMALLASAGAGIMIIMISTSLIILDIGTIILTLVSPIFFLAALHPGVGRRIAMGWVETLLKMALKRIALSIFLAVMIAIFTVMIQSAQEMEWAVSMILIVAIALGGVTYQKQVSEMFNGFSLGGQSMNPEQVPGANAAKKIGKKGIGIVGGGLGGGGRGAASALLSRDRSGKNAGRDMVKNLGAGSTPASKDDSGKRTWTSHSAPTNNGAGATPEGSTDSPTSNASDNKGAGDSPQGYNGGDESPVGDSESVPNVPVNDSPLSGSERVTSAPVVNDGAGQAPQSRAQVKEQKKDAKYVENFNKSRLNEGLRNAGYRKSTVTLGTVLKATAKGAIVGGATGSSRAGFRASSAVIQKGKQEVLSRNATAISTVRRSEAAHSKEMDKRNAQLEREKAAEKRQADNAKAKQEKAKQESNSRPQAPTPPRPNVPTAPSKNSANGAVPSKNSATPPLPERRVNPPAPPATRKQTRENEASSQPVVEAPRNVNPPAPPAPPSRSLLPLPPKRVHLPRVENPKNNGGGQAPQ